MEKFLISIIVPIYRVPELFLRKCIESIQNQTYLNLEILLVDDGSPDNSGEICDSYAEKDNRIKVIHKNNGGLSSARNAGVRAANGEWIMFVDGDDWIEPDMCEKMLQAGIENKVQLVMCGVVKDYGHSIVPYKIHLEDNRVYSGADCKWLQQQLLVYNTFIAFPVSKLICRKFLVDNGIEHDEMLKQGAEGLEFNLRVFEALESAVFINDSFYHYVYNDTSITASFDEQNYEYVVKCFEKIKIFVESSENREMLMPWFYNRMLYVVVTAAISGYFNPSNTAKYEEKKRKYKAYLNKPLIKEALKTDNLEGLSMQRKGVLFLIKNQLFWAINLLGIIRKWQKKYG